MKAAVTSRRALALVLAGAIAGAGAVVVVPATAQLQTTVPQNISRPPSFADIVDRVKPTVVSIYVSAGREPRVAERRRPQQQQPNERLPDLPDDHPLAELFKRFGRQFRAPNPEVRQAQGSGFFISADGYVVTNNHVIEGGTRFEVALDDKEKYQARLIGVDPRTDLALLKVDANKQFQFVKFAATPPRVGDWVLAIGNPFGLGGTVTAGIVSALSRDIGNGPYDFMQIDAAVNRGNSGGPTFNLYGEVVGVNTAIYSPSGGSIGIAFAIPAKLAIEVIEQLKTKGAISRGWLGVGIDNVDEDLAKSLGLKKAAGAIINSINPEGPAKTAGILEGDVILSVNGIEIESSRDLARVVAGLQPGSDAAVKLIRNRDDKIEEKTITVKLGTFPGTQQQAKVTPAPQQKPTPEANLLGLSLAPASKSLGGSTEGVVVLEVDRGSQAATKGIGAGDIIIEISGRQISTVEEVKRLIEQAKQSGRDSVMLKVRPNGEQQTRFVGLNIK